MPTIQSGKDTEKIVEQETDEYGIHPYITKSTRNIWPQERNPTIEDKIKAEGHKGSLSKHAV
jgi:hypothetical protein